MKSKYGKEYSNLQKSGHQSDIKLDMNSDKMSFRLQEAKCLLTSNEVFRNLENAMAQYTLFLSVDM